MDRSAEVMRIHHVLTAACLSLFGCVPATGTIGDLDEDPASGSDGGVHPPSDDPGSHPDDSGTWHGDTNTSPDTPTTPPPPPPGPELPLVKGLDITEVALFQGVKVPLEKSGVKVTKRTAAVVAGREGVFRVYVAPSAGFVAREVKGKLTLASASGAPLVIESSKTVAAASSDGALDSTINFEIPTGAIAPDTQYMVALRTDPGQPGEGSTTNARYPSSGTPESMDARNTGDALKIQIVPVKDGSGRMGDVSAAQLELYRKEAYAIYPARKVEISVHAPYAWSGSISADGSGFDELLDAMVTLRIADKAPKELYYYGAFANASSFDSYCGGGCVTGLCGLSDDPNDATVRACVGVGFTGKYTADTMAHEVGHAHGRYHAPCGGAAGADAKYPYSGAKIGSWGYDINTKALLSPTKYVDLMSYCEPTFISDYGFQQLIDRMSAVSGSKSIIGGDGDTRVRMVRVKGDGALTWGSELTLDEPLLSDPRTVTLEDAAGKTVASMTGHFYPYDHLPGGMLLVPSTKVPFATMKVSGLIAGVESRLVRATSP